MANQTALVIVREWCQSLGVLSAINVSRAEAEMKLAAYVPLLVREFPAGAFTADSLAHVAAAAVKGFPTYGELVASLRVWWADHRPMPPLLEPPPAPPPRDPTPEELARIRALVEEVTARVRANTNADETVSGGSYGARYLSAGQLDAINPLPNGRKRVTGAAS
jgi:hypothetical protein